MASSKSRDFWPKPSCKRASYEPSSEVICTSGTHAHTIIAPAQLHGWKSLRVLVTRVALDPSVKDLTVGGGHTERFAKAPQDVCLNSFRTRLTSSLYSYDGRLRGGPFAEIGTAASVASKTCVRFGLGTVNSAFCSGRAADKWIRTRLGPSC